jgi:cellulose synthase/poly-beta-1,6-N-acetylglucosamine synthase-like glycosyltransferase
MQLDLVIPLTLLILSTGLAAYILVGYPLLLAKLSWRQADPVRKDAAHQPSVTVILAVHNGQQFIRAKLDSLLALDYPAAKRDILVISDGSTDATDSLVQAYSVRDVRLLRQERAGKSAAVNAGIAAATGEILFFTDVRQPLQPDALRHLAANFADPTVGAVTGELQLYRPEQGEQESMDLYWRYEVWARQQHSRIDSIFNATGCIYAMRRTLAEPLPPDTLTDDAIIPLRAFFRGYRVVFDPAAVAFDYPAVAGTEFRRRMRTLAGLWQVYARLPQLFSSANRMRFHFLSHKFGRLLLPWTLLVTAIATWWLPPSLFRDTLLWGQYAFVALALLEPVVPQAFPGRRLFSLARTFTVMNLAAVAALAVFFVPAQKLWGTTQVTATARSGDAPS